VINASEEQAFVAGYREGVKMSTEKGKPFHSHNFNSIWPENLQRLSTWCSIGADVEYGKYAMLGARMGCYYTVLENYNKDLYKVRDLNHMIQYFKGVIDREDIDNQLLLFGNSLRQQLDLPIAEMDEAQSRFYRFVKPTHRNKGVQDRE